MGRGLGSGGDLARRELDPLAHVHPQRPTAPGDVWAPLINAAMSAHVQFPDSFFSAVLGAPGFNDPFTQQLAAIQLRTFGVFLLATAPAAAAASFGRDCGDCVRDIVAADGQMPR